MKAFLNAECKVQSAKRTRHSALGMRAFTIPELLLTMAVSVLISVAIVASQLYGIRMTELTQTRIHSSDKARQLMRLLTADIQSAHLIRVGAGSYSSFTEAAAETPHQGNAMQIYPSSDPNVFVRYFRATDDLKLKRMKSDGSLAEIAIGISNAVVFTVEDIAGNVLTDHPHNAVIGIDLQFLQLENPDLPVGPQHHYQSYRFRTRLAQPKLL